jgi:hypothetical protein
MEIKDLRTNQVTKHVITEYALDKSLDDIPTGNVRIETNLGFEIIVNRIELTNMFSYLVGIDKTIEESIESLSLNPSGY